MYACKDFTPQGSLRVIVDDLTGTEGSDQTKNSTLIKVFSSSQMYAPKDFTLQGTLLVTVDDFSVTGGSDQTKKLTSIKAFSFKTAALLKPEHIGGFIKSLAVSFGLNIFSEEFFARFLLVPSCLHHFPSPRCRGTLVCAPGCSLAQFPVLWLSCNAK